MLNGDWIHPEDVDWTDGLNPLRVPGWTENNNPYVYSCLQDPIFQALRNAKGIEPRLYTCPEQKDQLIQPSQSLDYYVPIEPNFHVYAITASGFSADDEDADFLLNVYDNETGSALFSQPVKMSTINAQRSGTANRGTQYFLSTPHLYLPPSFPVVRIINTSASAQICRVTLWGNVEYNT